MFFRDSRRLLQSALMFLICAALFVAALPASATPWAARGAFASPRFAQVWRDADRGVQQGSPGRSWTWGPQPWFDYYEIYKQSPNGLRLVQYFDKARMEINDPRNTSGPLGGVTNGLLVVEMVSGRIKLGNGVGADENQQYDLAAIPVAGDIGQPQDVNLGTPTYADFRDIATVDNGYRDTNKVGQRVGTIFVPGTSPSFRQDLADRPGTDIVVYENVTGHNIPRVFNDFMNAGPVQPLAAFGYPITDPYWIRARVAGQDRDVMVQLFERRTITYTPSNPRAFQVEMGNVGQHYFAWRYSLLGTPWVSPDPQWPIIYASKEPGPGFMAYQMNPDDRGRRALFGLVPYSVQRTWMPLGDPINHSVYGEITGVNDKRQAVGFQFFTRHPLSPIDNAPNFNNYDPIHSPDGKHLVFVSDRDGNPELFMIVPTVLGSEPYINSGRLLQLTNTSGCGNGRPTWLPDGTGLIYESNCQGGKFQIYRGNLSYTLEGNAQIRLAKTISPRQGEAERLTNTNTDERWPRVSPDGLRIAFFSNRDGNNEIYTMDLDGSRPIRLTNNPGRDEGPAWSPDSGRIVFNSDRDGDHELFMVNADSTGLTQLTANTVDDGYAVWGP